MTLPLGANDLTDLVDGNLHRDDLGRHVSDWLRGSAIVSVMTFKMAKRASLA